MNSKLPNNTELEKKFKFVTRWIFNGIFINLRSTKCVWWQKDLHKFKIRNWEFELDDSNTGSLQLICAAIETYGRIMLGYKDRNDRGFSEKSFTKFIEEFFPKIYQNKEKDIYVHYRCGLLHSYILGYNSPKGFFPTRSNGSNDRQYWDKHLWFTNSKANDVSEKGDDQHQRLIINIDTLFNDFKEAIEKFIKETEKDDKLKLNAEKSLEDIPIN